ncbi:MAG TPA: M28 family peptidase [Blastocatellia bacterium]|nr:M28 family peptidase [Blastocatellia bacterium]
MLRSRKITALVTQLALVAALTFAPAMARPNGGRDNITAGELKEWLTYLASDEFEGRNTFSEGLGLAAGYLAGQLKALGIKPGGPNGSYFQRVAVIGVKSDNKSTVTVEVNGQSRTFANKEGVTFPPFVGSKRSFTADQIEFLGYGLSLPDRSDYAGKNVKGKVVVYLGTQPPNGVDPRQAFRAMFGRGRNATEQEGAVATIGPDLNLRMTMGGGGGGQEGGAGRQNPIPQPDFTTVQRLDTPQAPNVSAKDDFFDFLFSGSDVKYADLKKKADAKEALPAFTLKNVRITFNMDAAYQVVRTQYTRNVIGVIEGTDPKLKDTYVAFGAHYDHVGYAEGEVVNGKRQGARGRVTDGAVEDRIWNGADDDGSGTVSILAIAKAFAQGPKPKRSLLFVWHAGEERGLYGSRYFADYPTVPMENLVAQINIDMIGRDRDNKAEESNTVYPVGSDRISTEFHNLTVEANTALATPLKLDYEMNDPADTEQIYYRSDHYSYAAKGVPIIFLTTGLHPDYHANTDSAEKINYEKMARIAQYAYEIGLRTANLNHAPARDNRGPRVGRTTAGKLAM